uniref:LAGLIDADG endonuclease n=7 Tax=Fusarium sambucinum species complex TaxID=569360 RepID=A5J048_GIBZE|nr:LAGLIDADG endonuclease [Fusarium graminearum]YP_009741038.1 LAGLIDADG endonuclease [Fusarium pseudograminearum]YP_009741100.1 LAGLIDADG endonuclease [Fusarium cerealis]YP_010390541.1 LAGLIDADG endonuclease [Fusarium acaciae-mearnsii]YP_010390597.1 LAGLIDADG endonuclease [Fusarium aethiopicum]YP_010390653.1 LAGLIDADG endonuclease [Fusarium asiaticum]YP_010390765.1 LAGLIDADG endonuclease [Fusarium boothii]YP_010390818.1 LAGLIDADG endonuclease [Fusarium brasilicum]YP_010390921.1 LAGLIDADG e
MVTGALLKFHYMRGHPLTLKSTSYFVAIGKIFNVGQSAGNLYNIQGSSETIRETIKIDNTFKWWLIGFAEGDGYFGVDKKGYLTFKVTQSTTDCQVLFFIKKSLGFGSVSLQSKSSKTHQYRVRDKNNLIKIINIFNGNLITKAKIAQFKLFLEAFNNKYNTDITFIECNKKVTLDNAWLSGFTDGEGCFTASAYLSKATNKHIVTVRYVISQKNDIEFSQYLAELINGYITYIKSYDGYNTVVNHSKLNIILNYIKSYPLKTKKHVSYLRWLKVYELVKDKHHHNPEGIEIIKSLIKLINK